MGGDWARLGGYVAPMVVIAGLLSLASKPEPQRPLGYNGLDSGMATQWGVAQASRFGDDESDTEWKTYTPHRHNNQYTPPVSGGGAVGGADMKVVNKILNEYGSLIMAASKESGVDPVLLAAQINQESSGNPNAVSTYRNKKNRRDRPCLWFVPVHPFDRRGLRHDRAGCDGSQEMHSGAGAPDGLSAR